jgi:hypothetical protein
MGTQIRRMERTKTDFICTNRFNPSNPRSYLTSFTMVERLYAPKQPKPP